MKNINMRLGAAILGVIITTVLVAGSTYAFGSGWGKGGHSFRQGFGGQGNNLKTAIENNNYSALGEDPKITEEQFSQIMEVHNLMEEGLYEEAKEMRQELGLNKKGFGMRMGMFGHGAHKMTFNSEKKEAIIAAKKAITAAIEAGDYSAWLQAVGENSPLAEKINEDNFSKLVEAHNLMQQARKIMEELDISWGMYKKWK